MDLNDKILFIYTAFSLIENEMWLQKKKKKKNSIRQTKNYLPMFESKKEQTLKH